MLERLRQSVAGMLAKILIGVLVVSFALWGIGDVFSQNTNPVIAEVGSEDITASRFLRSFQQSFYQLQLNAREQGQNISVEQARQAGLDRQVVLSLIGRSVLEQSADRIGLLISQEDLAYQIQRDETFQGAFGRFDAINFRNILQSSNLTEEEYLEELEGDLIQKQLTTIFSKPAPLPRIMIKEIYKAQNERRVAKYIVISTSKVKKIKTPSDDTLQEFIDNRPFDFTIPEKRKFEVLRLSPKKFTRTIKISTKRLREEYQLRLNAFRENEQRFIQQIIFPTQAEAKKARAKIKSGTSFVKLAEQRKLSKEDISLGWLERGQYASQNLEKAALKLRKGKISPVVETPLGWALLRLDKIKPAKQKTFSQVRKELHETLALAKAQEEIDTLHDLIEDEIGGGETLEQVAKKYKLPLVKSKLLKQEDTLPKRLDDIKDLKEKVWASPDEGTSQATATQAGGYYWLALTQIDPSRTQNLSQAKAKVKKLWQQDQALRLLEAKAKTFSQKLAAGSSFSSLTKQKVRQTPPLARTAESKLLSPDLIAALFRTPKGGTFYGASGDKKEIIIAQVVSIRQPQNLNAQQKKSEQGLTQEMRNVSANELLTQYLSNEQKQLGLNFYKNNLDLAFEQSPNQSR